MKSLYIDIETLPPLQWTDDEVDAYVRARIPGTYKKPESVAQWCEENRSEVFARAALDWRVSKIACIGVVFDNGVTTSSMTFLGGLTDEVQRRMFTELEWWLREHDAWSSVLVGHNILGFDLPRLHITAARLGHSLAAWFHDISEDHRRRVTDTMHLAFPTRERVSLADLCDALDIPGKTVHGSDVLPLWLAGDTSAILDYCLNDVLITRKAHLALSGAIDADT